LGRVGLQRLPTPADQVADKVVDAVLHNHTHVREPFMVKITPALKGLLPEAGFNTITDLLGVTSSMRSWHGHTADQQ